MECPQLEMQIDSLLLARLLKCSDKAAVLELFTKGQVIETPSMRARHS